MNPGPVEEAGQTARSFLDIMKEQPALLGSIVLNIGMLVFIFYALQSAAGFREKLTQQVLDNSNSIHQILTQRTLSCPDPNTTFKLQSDESKPAELPESK
jgi:hypothetical protein